MIDDELIARLRQASGRAMPELGILAAYVHGSRVAGRPRTDSDLDVGYFVEGFAGGRRLPVEVELALSLALSDAVGVDVDLRNLDDAPLELRGRVIEGGIRIHSGDDVRRVALERETLGRYHDYKDVFRQMHEIRLRRIARHGL
jgi:predicted nucleotidyltransferase